MKEIRKKMPSVVIFGRTNVGKSTLFNCLTERRQALISNIEGTTRDSNINKVSWSGFEFELIDTGGIMSLKNLNRKTKQTDDIDERVQQKVREHIKKADLILFLVDAKAGLMKHDREMAMFLKKRYPKNKILLVANKVDSPGTRPLVAEFNKLSLNEPEMVSALTGSGAGDLLDAIIKKIKVKKQKIEKEEITKVCLVGKPNVGKSSLLNKILGYEKVIVSDIPHTTREPQNIKLEHNKNIIEIIDTAGISRRGTKTKGLEKYGIEKSLVALKKADVALLVIDIKKGITHQDAKLVEEIIKSGSTFIILANKWDLVKEKDTKKYAQYIRGKFPFAVWAPIHFASALTGSKVDKILDLIIDISKNRKQKISNSQLSHFLNKIIKKQRPLKAKGTKYPRIYELTQLSIDPPKFEIRIGPKDTLDNSYVRYTENRLREQYGFTGTPIKISVVNERKIHGKAEATEVNKMKIKKSHPSGRQARKNINPGRRK